MAWIDKGKEIYMDKATETKKNSTIAISETQIETTISDNAKIQKTVMKSDGLHIVGQSLKG